MELGDVLEGMLEQDLPTFVPAHRAVRRSQEALPGVRSASHVSLGFFFEMTAKGLFGGEITNRFYVQDDEFTDHLIKPDVVDHGMKKFGEAKAWRWDKSINLFDEQIARYAELQQIHPEYAFYFSTFHHNFPAIKSYEGSEEALFAVLAKGPLAVTAFPLSIVLHLHSVRDNDYTRRYSAHARRNNSEFPSCTVVSPRIGRLLVRDPTELLKKVELDCEDYEVSAYKSQAKFHIQGNKMAPFFIRVIKDASHERWLDSFHERYANQSLITQSLRTDTGNVPY